MVRDSSDDRYIFSLTFKLNGTVRHVRIEHDQGEYTLVSLWGLWTQVSILLFIFQATLALVVLLASKATQLWISSRMLLSIHARVAISSSSTEDRLMGPCESNFCILSLESKKFKVCSICAGKLFVFSPEKNSSIFCLFRFVILKLVPRDHVDQLPVPKRIKDYLKTPNYYSENITEEEEEDEVEVDIKSPEAEEERPLEDTQNYAAAM